MSSICSPAMIYLVFSIIAIILMFINKYNNEIIVVKALVIIIWTWFLNFLCKKGLTRISWFLVILPFFLFFLMIIMMRRIIKLRLRQQK